MQQGFKEKLILELKTHPFNPTNATYISTSSKKTNNIFGFYVNQSLNPNGK